MHQVASLLGFHGSRGIRYLSTTPVPNGDALGTGLPFRDPV
jgi:hypothetical protein